MWHDPDAAIVGFPRGVAGAAHAAAHAPPTLAIVVGAGLAVLVAVFLLALALVSNRRPPGREGDDDQGSGPGGGGPGRPDPDGGDAPGGVPAWWLDFEREFAEYVSQRDTVIEPGCPSRGSPAPSRICA
jgi:hypothetical protein